MAGYIGKNRVGKLRKSEVAPKEGLVGKYVPDTPINIGTTAAGTPINTGIDLTQETGMVMYITFADRANSRPWQDVRLNLDHYLARVGGTDVLEGYISVYDNDHAWFMIEDAAQGIVAFREVGRDWKLMEIRVYGEG